MNVDPLVDLVLLLIFVTGFSMLAFQDLLVYLLITIQFIVLSLKSACLSYCQFLILITI